MTQEQIVELLNRKIKQAIMTSEQDHGHNTEWRREYETK